MDKASEEKADAMANDVNHAAYCAAVDVSGGDPTAMLSGLTGALCRVLACCGCPKDEVERFGHLMVPIWEQAVQEQAGIAREHGEMQ